MWWGWKVTENVQGTFRLGPARGHLLSLHLHRPYVPPPAPSSGKTILCISGPHSHSRLMYFQGSRGMAPRPQDSSRPGKLLSASPARPPSH